MSNVGKGEKEYKVFKGLQAGYDVKLREIEGKIDKVNSQVKQGILNSNEGQRQIQEIIKPHRDFLRQMMSGEYIKGVFMPG
ncbi:MAG: hypothetical protein C5B43_00605, partial [Verrucomicrobia bacterium]